MNLPVLNKKGFTLVELMVAISIVAILAVVGLVVYGNVQATARNSQREQSLQAITTALESNKPPGSTIYPQILDTQFSGGTVPTDPKAAATAPATQKYCLIYSETNPPTTASQIPKYGVGQFISNWTSCTVTGTGTGVPIANAIPVVAVKMTSWAVCARDETDQTATAATKVFCKYNKL